MMNGENILIREYLAEWDIVCHRAAAFSSLVKKQGFPDFSLSGRDMRHGTGQGVW